MIKPPIPADDARRVETLRSLGLLDTDPEERFDRITRLAQRLFGVPIALVSLIDADRQWFKSKVGIEDTETPREESFCAHAINGDEILQVSDARTDPRFSDNPAVLGDPNVRFYAGCPIAAPDGQKMGTLCVIDDQPRDLTPEDAQALRDLAAMVEQEMAALAMATTDGLTGLSNRRGFEGLGHQVLAVSDRLGRPVSLIYTDLDAFKSINDTYGHAEGDRAIIAAADLLRSCFRECDVIARLGGDEFAILATGAADPAAAVARLQDAAEHHNRMSGRPYRLAFSAGSATRSAGAHISLDALIAEADAAMYTVKTSRHSHAVAR